MNFYHANTSGYLHLLLESGKCDTSRSPFTPGSSPGTAGNWTGQLIQPVGKKKYKSDSAKQILIGQSAWRKCKTDFDWTECMKHCKPSPFGKQFCLAYTAVFPSYITSQNNQQKIFNPKQM